jgi:hypothetical protein
MATPTTELQLDLRIDADAGQATLTDGDGVTVQTLPIRPVRWLDERGLCTRAHDYLSAHAYRPDAEGADDLPDFRACSMYAAGATCLLNGRQAASPCVFSELPDGAGWQAVRSWRKLPGDHGICSMGHYAELCRLMGLEAEAWS